MKKNLFLIFFLLNGKKKIFSIYLGVKIFAFMRGSYLLDHNILTLVKWIKVVLGEPIVDIFLQGK